MTEPTLKKNRNVLLVTADQWRADCLGVAGHPLVQTPNLDALAREAVHFTNHFAGAAPCSPARACLYTDLYQMNNRVCRNGSPLDERHDNIARAARRAGYDPVVFGYTDQTADPRTTHENDPKQHTYESILPGFSTRVQLADHESRWLGWLERQSGQPAERETVHFPRSGVSDPPNTDPPVYNHEQTSTAYIAGELIDWLGEQKYFTSYTGQGWFAHASFLRPHPPFCVPEPYNTLYSPEHVMDFAGAGDWQVVARTHPWLAYVLSTIPKSQFIPGLDGLVRDWDSAALKTIAAIYFGMITEVDAQLGRIFDALKAQGQWENTVIVFTSDHGEMLGDHCMLGKYGFHDASYHIPLIIRDPRNTAGYGSKVTEFSEAVDVFPTLMAVLDEPVPSHLDGKSLKPALLNEPLPAWRASAHWEYDFRDIEHQHAEQQLGIPSQLCNLCVIRDENFKYVHFAAMPALLFDLQKDPGESVNVAELEEYQSVRLFFAEKLLRWRAEHLDQSLALSAATAAGLVNR